MVDNEAVIEEQRGHRIVGNDELPPAQQKRWDAIVRAALELLDSDGDYDQIQMRDVAARADVALGTLYRYFASKEHLYAAVMAVWFRSFHRRLERQRLPEEPGEALKELLSRAIRAFAKKPQFLRVEIVLEGSTDVYANQLFSESSASYVAAYREVLAGLTETEIRQIETMVGCVLTTKLHRFALGRDPIERVLEDVLGSVDLVFSPPPQVHRVRRASATPARSTR
ncbi:MAG: TetR/AcrR family transcriptional regulator [Ilumatobacteraceae bacterium]|nr:TetR/AcrR family transcriptional regulator [Ilumatobacteraceae bacterium]